MSWLSEALDRNGLGAVNKIAGPIVSAAGSVAKDLPGIGSLVSLGQQFGGMVPDVFKGSGASLPALGTLVGQKSGSAGSTGNSTLDQLLGLAGVGNAGYLQDKANNFAKLAGESADRAYQEKAPLRQAGIAGMQAAPVTLPSLTKIRTTGNPFATG